MRIIYLPGFLMLFFYAMPHSAISNVILPAIFSDHMVLQQKSDVRIWGWAKPLEHIHLRTSWLQEEVQTVTDNQANWSFIIPTPAAGGPHRIEITGYNTVTLENVMIGEVWLCAGQSNMEWTARMGFDHAQEEVAIASHPDIRFFSIDHRTATTPQLDVRGGPWKPCTPETMIDFSGVAYFFARRLQQELNVPVGLINASWGGTPAEAWTAMEYCTEAELIIKTAGTLQEMPWGPEEPGSIYHAMVAPLINYRIAGVIWYQGETHAENLPYNPAEYSKVFPALIRSWREAWGYQYPFYFVQISPYSGYADHRGVIVRDAQRRTLALDETAMVVTGDIGDIRNLHPGNKRDVGVRLAQIALTRLYQVSDKVDSGPLYHSHEVLNDAIRLHFDYAGGLYHTGKALTGFEIAGDDGVYYPAVARIENQSVIAQSKQVPHPVQVRYAWENDALPSLFNEAHLPASSFTTATPD